MKLLPGDLLLIDAGPVHGLLVLSVGAGDQKMSVTLMTHRGKIVSWDTIPPAKYILSIERLPT